MAVIENPAKAIKLGITFLDAGLDVIEVTMRTERAIEAVQILNEELPAILVGAGTVFSLSVAKEAVAKGAQFIVSPHIDEEIVAYCMDNDVVCIPGAFTPTEVHSAIKAASRNGQGSSITDAPMAIKIFPASTGGPSHIKALKAVFPEVRFVPLGGVNADNLADYLNAGAWAVGGTWVCERKLIETDNFAEISRLVQEALHIIAETRKGGPPIISR